MTHMDDRHTVGCKKDTHHPFTVNPLGEVSKEVFDIGVPLLRNPLHDDLHLVV